MALLDLAGFVRGADRMPPAAANPRARVFEMPPVQPRFEMPPAPTVYEMPARDGGFRAGGRIFIADDDEDVRAAVASVLESAGLTPVAGARADLERLRMESFDLMLVDLDLFEEVRAIPGAAGIPAIVLGAPDRGELVVQALESGADDFITKPVDPAILHARVSGILRRRKVEGAAAAIAEDLHGVVDAIVANTSLLLAALPVSDPNGQVLAHIAAAGERAAELTRQLIADRPCT
jgi:DNA-binding response OmpR family regulator